MEQQEPRDVDEAMQEYLRSLNLQQLDLADIDLDVDAPSPWWRYGRWSLAAGAVGIMFFLPNTSWYQLHSDAVWLLVGLGGAAAWLATGSLAPLWRGLRGLVGVLAQGFGGWSEREVPTFRLPPALTRWAMLLVALGLGGTMLFFMPRDAEWVGSGYSGSWFLAVAMALVTGILLGRWLIAQANASGPPEPDAPAFVFPPWFKWATLSVLIAGGLVAAFGHHFIAGDPESLGFSLGGVGFAVGVLGAIWIARRFDEMEEELRQRQRRDRDLSS